MKKCRMNRVKRQFALGLAAVVLLPLAGVAAPMLLFRDVMGALSACAAVSCAGALPAFLLFTHGLSPLRGREGRWLVTSYGIGALFLLTMRFTGLAGASLHSGAFTGMWATLWIFSAAVAVWAAIYGLKEIRENYSTFSDSSPKPAKP